MSKSSESILILEDDPDLRTSLAELLEEEGYEVVAVGQGEDAVRQSLENDFDLIIADVRMPGMDGLQALAKVREKQPSIRSMVVSGYSSEADNLRALSLGVGLYLRKPFQLQTFLDAVEKIMSQRRQERALAAKERSLRRTAIWALETVSQRLGPDFEDLVGLGRQASRVANLAGLGEEAAEETQMTALVALLHSTQEVDTAHMLDALPQQVRQNFNLLEERWDGDGPEGLKELEIPLPARIASLCVATRTGQVQAGSYNPELTELFHRPAQLDDRLQLQSGSDSEQRKTRTKLQLAKILEGSNQREAHSLYQEILQLKSISKESVEALLGLSRIDQAQRSERARQACNIARQISPTVYANACLEIGLLFGESGGTHLEEASRVFRQLKQPAPLAKSELALALLQGQELNPALEILNQPQHQQEFRSCAPWLLSPLLNRDDSNLERSLSRLTHLASQECQNMLPLFSEAQRSRLAQIVRWESELLKTLENDPSEAVRRIVKATRDQMGEQGEASNEPQVRIYTLGSFEIFNQDGQLPDKIWKNQKIAYLVGFLASRVARTASEDQILDHFWPLDLEKGKKSLYVAVSTIRKRLGEDFVRRSPQGIGINPEAKLWMDLDQFNQLAPESQMPEDEQSLDRWRQAAALYRGPFMNACYMEWANGVRDRCSQKIEQILTQLSSVNLQQNRPLETLEHAYRLVELDACSQQGYLLLMQANLALGRAEAALRLFEQCRKTLHRELALEPSIPLIEAQQRALLNLT